MGFFEALFGKKKEKAGSCCPAKGTGNPGSIKTILVVDDDSEIRDMMKSFLESKGHQVVVGIDGKDGLDKARSKHPDLVILDVNMPRMDGFKVLEHLKKDPKTMNVPVIMLTTRTAHEDMSRAIEAYADKYIPKPFDPPHLLQEIEKTLKHS